MVLILLNFDYNRLGSLFWRLFLWNNCILFLRFHCLIALFLGNYLYLQVLFWLPIIFLCLFRNLYIISCIRFNLLILFDFDDRRLHITCNIWFAFFLLTIEVIIHVHIVNVKSILMIKTWRILCENSSHCWSWKLILCFKIWNSTSQRDTFSSSLLTKTARCCIRHFCPLFLNCRSKFRNIGASIITLMRVREWVYWNPLKLMTADNGILT